MRAWLYTPAIEVRIAAAPMPGSDAHDAAADVDNADVDVDHDDDADVPAATTAAAAVVTSPASLFGHDALITNGAGGDATERVLLEEGCPELVRGGATRERVRAFLRDLFAALAKDPQQLRALAHEVGERGEGRIRKYALAGVDLMLSSDGQLFLLELNRSPAAPPADKCRCVRSLIQRELLPWPGSSLIRCCVFVFCVVVDGSFVGWLAGWLADPTPAYAACPVAMHSHAFREHLIAFARYAYFSFARALSLHHAAAPAYVVVLELALVI